MESITHCSDSLFSCAARGPQLLVGTSRCDARSLPDPTVDLYGMGHGLPLHTVLVGTPSEEAMNAWELWLRTGNVLRRRFFSSTSVTRVFACTYVYVY
jgi:hypothetical protein